MLATMTAAREDSAYPAATIDERRHRLAELHRGEYRSLVRLAALLVDERGAAEEIVQEAFVRLDRSWDRVTDPDRLDAYLRSIVLNLARSGMRRRRVALRHAERGSPTPAAAAADERAVLREDQAEVLAALRTLPTRQREVLVLRFWQDATETEIADALGISVGSVKTHLHRALGAMTTKLEATR